MFKKTHTILLHKSYLIRVLGILLVTQRLNFPPLTITVVVTLIINRYIRTNKLITLALVTTAKISNL